MNTSKRTVVVAEAICLWARIQDCPDGAAPEALYAEWRELYARYPKECDFGAAQQFDLFDRINALNW